MSISAQLNTIYSAVELSLALQFRLFISLVFHLLKKCVEFFLTRKRPELRRIISSNHYLGPDGKLIEAHNLLISIKIRGLLNVQEFQKAFLASCVLKRDLNTGCLEYPELQEEIGIHWGYPFWKHCDKQFAIDGHISGGDVFEDLGPLNEDTCLKIEKIVISREFKRCEGSPWKIYLLHENLAKITRLLFVFHHSLGDGQSMYGLLMRLASQNSVKGKLAIVQQPSWMDSIRQILPPRNPLLVPVRLMRNLIKCGVPPPFLVPQEKLLSQEDRFIVKSSTIKKSKLSKLSQRSSVPFTGVLLSAITGALREYLVDADLHIPEFVLCPMPVPLTRAVRTGLTNSIVEFALPFGMDDAKDRLLDCKQGIIESQTSAFPLMVRLGLFIENGYPLAWKPLAGVMPPIILSSFAGPKSSESILENEHEILDMDFTWNGTKYASVIFTTLTYCDRLRTVLSADPNAFQFEQGVELTRIMEYIEDEITLLQKYKYKPKSLKKKFDLG